jgi:hypothetical protein
VEGTSRGRPVDGGGFGGGGGISGCLVLELPKLGTGGDASIMSGGGVGGGGVVGLRRKWWLPFDSNGVEDWFVFRRPVRKRLWWSW